LRGWSIKRHKVVCFKLNTNQRYQQCWTFTLFWLLCFNKKNALLNNYAFDNYFFDHWFLSLIKLRISLAVETLKISLAVVWNWVYSWVFSIQLKKNLKISLVVIQWKNIITAALKNVVLWTGMLFWVTMLFWFDDFLITDFLINFKWLLFNFTAFYTTMLFCVNKMPNFVNV
jgi:hypothetical protein